MSCKNCFLSEISELNGYLKVIFHCVKWFYQIIRILLITIYASLFSNSELLRQWKRRVPKIPVAGRLDVIDGDVAARVALRQTDVSIIGLCLDIKKPAYAK